MRRRPQRSFENVRVLTLLHPLQGIDSRCRSIKSLTSCSIRSCWEVEGEAGEDCEGRGITPVKVVCLTGVLPFKTDVFFISHSGTLRRDNKCRYCSTNEG